MLCGRGGIPPPAVSLRDRNDKAFLGGRTPAQSRRTIFRFFQCLNFVPCLRLVDGASKALFASGFLHFFQMFLLLG